MERPYEKMLLVTERDYEILKNARFTDIDSRPWTQREYDDDDDDDDGDDDGGDDNGGGDNDDYDDNNGDDDSDDVKKDLDIRSKIGVNVPYIHKVKLQPKQKIVLPIIKQYVKRLLTKSMKKLPHLKKANENYKNYMQKIAARKERLAKLAESKQRRLDALKNKKLKLAEKRQLTHEISQINDKTAQDKDELDNLIDDLGDLKNQILDTSLNVENLSEMLEKEFQNQTELPTIKLEDVENVLGEAESKNEEERLLNLVKELNAQMPENVDAVIAEVINIAEREGYEGTVGDLHTKITTILDNLGLESEAGFSEGETEGAIEADIDDDDEFAEQRRLDTEREQRELEERRKAFVTLHSERRRREFYERDEQRRRNLQMKQKELERLHGTVRSPILQSTDLDRSELDLPTPENLVQEVGCPGKSSTPIKVVIDDTPPQRSTSPKVNVEMPNFKLKQNHEGVVKYQKLATLFNNLKRFGYVSSKHLHYRGNQYPVDMIKLMQRAIADTHRPASEVKNFPCGWNILMKIATERPELINHMGELVKTQFLREEFKKYIENQYRQSLGRSLHGKTINKPLFSPIDSPDTIRRKAGLPPIYGKPKAQRRIRFEDEEPAPLRRSYHISDIPQSISSAKVAIPKLPTSTKQAHKPQLKSLFDAPPSKRKKEAPKKRPSILKDPDWNPKRDTKKGGKKYGEFGEL